MSESIFAKILDFIVSAGRVFDKDSAENEAEFEASERGLNEDDVKRAGTWARNHYNEN